MTVLRGGWSPVGASVAGVLVVVYLVGLAALIQAIVPPDRIAARIDRAKGAITVTIAGRAVDLAGQEVTAPTAAELEIALEKAGLLLNPPGSAPRSVPAVYLDQLPNNFAAIESAKKRKTLFIASVLPLALAVNERLVNMRTRLQALQRQIEENETLSGSDRAWLEKTAESFGIAPDKMDRVLLRVDAVPVPIVLAQAAVESGWGTSRFALEGNALFGQWTWGKRKGIIPEDRPEGKTHQVRSFRRLIDSVVAYMHNLNTHRAYAVFRAARADLRKSGNPTGLGALVAALKSYSTRGGDYIAELRTVIRQNRLMRFQGIRLQAQFQRIAQTPKS